MQISLRVKSWFLVTRKPSKANFKLMCFQIRYFLSGLLQSTGQSSNFIVFTFRREYHDQVIFVWQPHAITMISKPTSQPFFSSEISSSWQLFDCAPQMHKGHFTLYCWGNLDHELSVWVQCRLVSIYNVAICIKIDRIDIGNMFTWSK